jgi:ATP-binding cassette subfamily B protein
MSHPSPLARGGGRGLRSFTQDSSVAHQHLHQGTIRRILGFATPYRKALASFLALITVDAAAGAASPLVIKRLIDQGITAGDRRVVVILAAVLAGLAILAAVLTVAERWFSARIGEGLIFDLRTQVFDHVQRMPLAFFSRARTGALVQRLNGDVLGAQQAFTSTLSSIVSNALTIAFVVAAMLSLSWQLTLVSLVLLPVFILPARFIGRRLASITRESYGLNADTAQMMNERFNVAGAHLVKVFGRPDDESVAFAEKAAGVRDIGVKSAVLGTYFRAGLTAVAAVGVAIVYGAGGIMAIDGSLTVGMVVALTAYLARLYGPITAMSNVQVDVMTALVSFERVLEVLDLEPMVADAPHAHDLATDLAEHGAAVEMEQVRFRYPLASEVSLASLESVAQLTNDPVDDTLHDVTFTIPAGATVAVVGPSGAGKTTVSQLATRMYDPTSGTVRIAGADLREVTQASLHAAVGVVTQEAHLFHDSIAANLRFARPEATDAELWHALERARVADLVASLPSGIDTVVGDRGFRLSGGERQRVAIARVLLKQPAFVVLDEATAHLDSESEAAVQAALDEALASSTALVIAHRLSTVRNADLLVVLDEGHVVQQGTHAELIAAGGLYADLYRTQFAAPVVPAGPSSREG